MFGFVTADMKQLSKEQEQRYRGVYCGICCRIRKQSSQIARLSLSYDMAFLALLLMSLYEPKEAVGGRGCALHPIRSKGWIDNEFVRYAADMNVALAYYKALDDVHDEKRLSARFLASGLRKDVQSIQQRFPRQCEAIAQCIQTLGELEEQGCANPDYLAGCFGKLMGALLVYYEDLWAPTLRQMGDALGRYIYLVDAAVDYRKDRKKNKFNPFLTMNTGEDWARWEEYLVMAMGRCTRYYESLPLVQDKPLLDHILYSGIWMEFKRCAQRAGEDKHDQ